MRADLREKTLAPRNGNRPTERVGRGVRCSDWLRSRERTFRAAFLVFNLLQPAELATGIYRRLTTVSIRSRRCIVTAGCLYYGSNQFRLLHPPAFRCHATAYYSETRNVDHDD